MLRRPQELRPARLEPVRRRLGLLLEDRPDRARGERGPEPTSSPWIRRYPQPGFSRAAARSARESQPQLPAGRTPVGTVSGARPTPVPAQNRPRRHERSPPHRPRQASQRRQNRPISRRLRPSSLRSNTEAGGGAAGSRSPSPLERKRGTTSSSSATDDQYTNDRTIPANGPPRALTPPVRANPFRHADSERNQLSAPTHRLCHYCDGRSGCLSAGQHAEA